MTVSAATRYHDRLKKKRQAIKIKQGQLGLDEATYRLLLKRVAGVTSSTALMTQDAADAVLAELQRLGAPVSSPRPRVKNEWGFVFRLTGERQTLGKKILPLRERKIGGADPARQGHAKGLGRRHRPPGGRDECAKRLPARFAKPLETCTADELMTIIKILESGASSEHAHDPAPHRSPAAASARTR